MSLALIRGEGDHKNVADIFCEWLLTEGESGTVDKSDARFDEKHAPSSGREGEKEETVSKQEKKTRARPSRTRK